jgi:ribosomal protein S18 acetylase RimI-like enzyme
MTSIYRASREDLDAVRVMLDEYYALLDVMVRDTPSQLEQYLNDHSGIWLAANEAQLIGCVILRPLKTQPQACEVKRLYVREQYRGMSIADKLMNALEAHAIRQGYRYIYLDTSIELQSAIRFYTRRGYVNCKRYNDNPQASVFMQRLLSSEQ